MTQAGLAQKAGLHLLTVAKIEQGLRASPGWDTVLALANALEVPVGVFAGEDETAPPHPLSANFVYLPLDQQCLAVVRRRGKATWEEALFLGVDRYIDGPWAIHEAREHRLCPSGDPKKMDAAGRRHLVKEALKRLTGRGALVLSPEGVYSPAPAPGSASADEPPDGLAEVFRHLTGRKPNEVELAETRAVLEKGTAGEPGKPRRPRDKGRQGS
jgi:transcriptional regulator with XRE-family HTH domain